MASAPPSSSVSLVVARCCFALLFTVAIVWLAVALGADAPATPLSSQAATVPLEAQAPEAWVPRHAAPPPETLPLGPHVGTPSQEDQVLRMHLKPAPTEIQAIYSAVAKREVEGYRARIETASQSADASIEGYLQFLVLSRDERMRALALAVLEQRKGVLAFNGLKSEAYGANFPKVTYLGVGNYFGRQADLLVCVDDPVAVSEIGQLSATIEQVATTILVGWLANFNAGPQEHRVRIIQEFRSSGTLPGVPADVLYILRDKMRIDDSVHRLGLKS